MRTTKTLSVSLAPELFDRAIEMAKLEGRNLSELVREALREYDHAREWNKKSAFGAMKIRAGKKIKR